MVSPVLLSVATTQNVPYPSAGFLFRVLSASVFFLFRTADYLATSVYSSVVYYGKDRYSLSFWIHLYRHFAN